MVLVSDDVEGELVSQGMPIDEQLTIVSLRLQSIEQVITFSTMVGDYGSPYDAKNHNLFRWTNEQTVLHFLISHKDEGFGRICYWQK